MRGCGNRIAGGIYIEIDECIYGAPNGRPMEHFLCDPPSTIDLKAAGISKRGITIAEQDGIWHLFDWVGEKHYPYPADFLEEARLQGVSRRIQKNADFEKLTSKSRLILIHRKAWVTKPWEYYENWTSGVNYDRCPKGYCYHHCAIREYELGIAELHNDPDHAGMCAGIFWQDIPKEQLDDYDGEKGYGIRRQPGATYRSPGRPHGITPEYRSAIFAIFPLGKLAVVRDTHNGKHEDAYKKASNSNIEVEIVDE